VAVQVDDAFEILESYPLRSGFVELEVLFFGELSGLRFLHDRKGRMS